MSPDHCSILFFLPRPLFLNAPRLTCVILLMKFFGLSTERSVSPLGRLWGHVIWKVWLAVIQALIKISLHSGYELRDGIG